MTQKLTWVDRAENLIARLEKRFPNLTFEYTLFQEWPGAPFYKLGLYCRLVNGHISIYSNYQSQAENCITQYLFWKMVRSINDQNAEQRSA